MKDKRTWKLTDHICGNCGGRVLQGVAGFGPSGGGNPAFICADCGEGGSDTGPWVVCWCGFRHRGQDESPFRCLPFSILEMYPAMSDAFARCGCNPKKGLVGIVTTQDYYRYLKNLNE